MFYNTGLNYLINLKSTSQWFGIKVKRSVKQISVFCDSFPDLPERIYKYFLHTKILGNSKGSRLFMINNWDPRYNFALE